MTRYTIEVKYTSNEKKAGKLEIKNELGNTLLKSDVVLPKSMHTKDVNFMSELSLKRFVPENYYNENKFVDENRLNRMRSPLGDFYIEKDMNSPLILRMKYFYSVYENSVTGYNGAITVAPEAFDLLKSILSEPNNKLDFKAEKKLFMFGQKPCAIVSDVFYAEHIRNGKNIAAEEVEITKREQEKIAKELEVQRDASKKSVIAKSIEPSLQAPKNSINQKSSKIVSSKQSFNASSRNYSNDGIDPFDVMYMTAFPDMAPFFRPNSGLAWMIYFNNLNSRDNLVNDPVNCINEINGFEDIKGCDVEVNMKTNNGAKYYNINFYADEDKIEYLGTAQYSEEKGLVIKDSFGNTTMVSEMQDKPGYTVLVEGENSSKALVEVVQDRNNELVGNWTIEPYNSIMMSSSLKIGEDLTLSSDVNKTINLDNVSTSNHLSVDNLYKTESAQTMDLNPTIENENKYEREYEPPPPPPPPPEDNYTFTSSDPYSRSGLSM